MKKLRQIVTEVKTNSSHTSGEFNKLLWQLICYSPKMPVRFQQQQLLDEAETFTLQAKDEFFACRNLNFNGFKWGNGKHKLLVTHGWGSKAADFTEMITALQTIDDLQIIAFDAPGNGSSEGDLSNLLLYVEAIKSIITAFGEPDVFIGHSLGGIANVMAIKEAGIKPGLLISLSPLARLKENFEASMSTVDVSPKAQHTFLDSFEQRFGSPAAQYNLIDLYDFKGKHWLAYDEHDLISPYSYVQEFLNFNPLTERCNYENTGHEKMIKSPEVIDDILALIKISL
jgi:hypothetical protein